MRTPRTLTGAEIVTEESESVWRAELYLRPIAEQS